MTRILVTGSNGLLGQKLVAQLNANPNFDLLATSRGENRIEQVQGFAYRAMDITSSEEVVNVFSEFKPEVVINTAAMTNVDACEGDRESCWKMNVEAVEALITACQEHDSHLIHLSTDFVFDGEDGPYREEDQPNPLSYYGESKHAAEQLLLKSNLKKWAIVRTIIVYGIGDNMSRSNIVLWAKDALEQGKSLNIVDDQFRSPTLAEDLADACVLIAEKEATGIYHVSGKDLMSILELVQRVGAHFNLSLDNVSPAKSSDFSTAAARPPKTGFILDKAIKDLGYAPHSFEEGLAILDEQLGM